MSAQETAAERVARGAAWLDRERPGWALCVETADLVMPCCKRCVMGQIFGDFEQGLHYAADEGAPPATDAIDAIGWSVAHGFQAVSCGSPVSAALEARDWSDLGDAWLAEIEKRRQA